MAETSTTLGCRLREITGWSLVQITGWRGSLAGIAPELAGICGAPVPEEVGATASVGSLLMIRVAPGRVWVIDAGGSGAARLEAAIDPARGAVARLDHGRRRFRLEGLATREIMARTVALDLDALTPGRAAQTGLHHVPVLLHRPDGEAFDLYVPRSFARSLREWLTGFGFELGRGPAVQPPGA